MTRILAVAKREFKSYFTTPVGFIVLGTFALISGLFFTAMFLIYARVSVNPSSMGYTTIPDFEEMMLSPFLVFCGQLIMFIGPLITMRLLAEERNRGTMELLLTHPLRDREIILGKYLAAVSMLVVMMLVVGVYLVLLSLHTTVEPAVLGLGLVTVFLMGAAFLSMGLFVSSMARNQITAGVMTFALWFISYIFGMMGKDLPDAIPAPANWPAALQDAAGWAYGVFRTLVEVLPLDAHAQALAQGILTPEGIAYYLLTIVFFLFLTGRAFESRRWRA
jgi:ABC-2 type transport system permease protein